MEAIPTIVTVILGVVAALLFGANTFAKPKRGRAPLRAERPEEPERPDITEHKRDEAVADHEADAVADAVADAIKAGDDRANPHGLADLLNRK